MRLAVLAFAFVCIGIAAAAQVPHTALQNGRATCYSLDPAKLTVAETKAGDWQVRRDDGWIIATLPTKDDADAALAVAKKYTAACVIGQGTKRFQYFEPAR